MSKISIITPVFNRQNIISATLDSVQKQEYENWECILVDDGSQDNVGAVIKAYANKDPRFKYFKRPTTRQKGPSACRNYGMEQAEGDFYLFLDSDDLLTADCLADRVKAIQENPDDDFVVFTMGFFYEVNEFHRNKKKKVFQGNRIDTAKQFLAYKYPWSITRPLYRKEIIGKVGGFNENLMALEDPEMALKILQVEGVTYKTIDKVDCYYRLDVDQKEKFRSAAQKQRHLDSYLTMFQSLFTVFTAESKEILTPFIKYNLVKFLSVDFDKEVKAQLTQIIKLFKNNINFSVVEKTYIRMLLEINLKNRPRGTYRIIKKIQNYFKDKCDIKIG